MTPARPSIRRHLMVWVVGALCVGAVVLSVAAYLLTLHEINEVLDDSLRQTALLLADRDTATSMSGKPVDRSGLSAATESKLVEITRGPDGSLLSTSEPQLNLRFAPIEGHSQQRVDDETWDVFTVIQVDRTVQVGQPVSVRRELAAESASKLLLPLMLLVAMIGVLLVVALRRGLRPLQLTTDALAARSADRLAPLALADVPTELVPMVRTINDLLARLDRAFDAQRHFVADAAHELRSPITALQLQVQLLAQSESPAESERATAELAAGIARMRRVLDQLLSLARASGVDDGDRSGHGPVRLADVVRSVVALRSVEAEGKGIDLGADVRSDVEIEGNVQQIEILLGNFVENALRYTPAGGVVDVLADEIDGAPALRVVDDGPGIAPADRTRVFDRFYRTSGAVATAEVGSGLGLAIVKAIAERHGATVSVHEGRAGRGLEARAIFPGPGSAER